MTAKFITVQLPVENPQGVATEIQKYPEGMVT